jgi:hypothetical protein
MVCSLAVGSKFLGSWMLLCFAVWVSVGMRGVRERRAVGGVEIRKRKRGAGVWQREREREREVSNTHTWRCSASCLASNQREYMLYIASRDMECARFRGFYWPSGMKSSMLQQR